MIKKDLIKKDMIIKNRVTLILSLLLTSLLFTNTCWADHEQIFDAKTLKEAGKISSLTNILDKLSEHDIHRILEIELKQDSSREAKHPFIYEIEYINGKGMVLEIEVDALSAQVLNTEREY